MRGARLFENFNGMANVAVEERTAGGHGVDGCRVVWGWIALKARRVVGLWVAPAADLETKLARVRPLGEDGVEAREATLLAVRPDEALPLQGIRQVRGA